MHESDRILLGAWDVMNETSPGFEIVRGGPALFEISWMGHPCAFFNLAVLARTPASIDAFRASLIDELLPWTASRQHGWILSICHETIGSLMPAATAVLDELGLKPYMPLTGMEATEPLAPPARPLREDAVLVTESNGSDVIGDRVIRINEDGYGMAFGDKGSLQLERPGWWSAPRRMATVASDASSSTVVDVGGIRYVALVATRPSMQKQGYAETAMRDVLSRSLNAGLSERTYLHASAMGRPLYAQMGYRVTAEHTVFLRH